MTAELVERYEDGVMNAGALPFVIFHYLPMHTHGL
jgi:hypothetical protein